MTPAVSEPFITVGIIDGRTDIAVRLDGGFAHGSGSGLCRAGFQRMRRRG